VRSHLPPRLGSGLLGLCLAIPFATLESQAPGQRRALDALADSLEIISDTTWLRARQHAERALARDRDSAFAGVRLGLVSLRLAELGASPGAKEALRALRGAAERRPDWPYAWYVLGRAEAHRSAWEQENRLELGSRVGLRTLERAAGCHARALQADPAFTAAAVELAALTLALRDTALVEPAVAGIRRAAAVPASSPEVLLALGRLERAAGRFEPARVAFSRYLEAGGNRAIGLLELARAGLAAGRPDAESAYYEGAALDDSLAAAGFRSDLATIATEAELARFDRTRGSERAELLRRFWADRDRLEMRQDGERLREHYRRLLHARRHFALTVSRRYYGPADAYRSGGLEIDDRGVIYVRHGEPAERLRPFVFGLMPNESWHFRRADGDLLFHFSAGYDSRGGGDLYDYRLVESVLDLRGAGDAPRDQLLLSRQALSPLYARILNWGRYGAARSRAKERGIGRASIAVGTTTDSHELQFAGSLQAVADLVGIGASDSLVLGHLVFAVAAPAAAPGRDLRSVRYPVRIRAVASDSAGRPRARLDTTIVFRAMGRRGTAGYLIGRAEMPVAPGRWTWRAALQVGDSLGVVLPSDTVSVSRHGPAFGISDLALGVRGASARWEPAPGDTVLLTPFDRFIEGADVELYYEVPGVRAGSLYRHEIAVFRMKGDRGVAERRPAVTLGFEEPAAGPVLRSQRVLQLSRLKPGRYLIEVRVRAEDGDSVLRRRELRIARSGSE
jgi:GWxTD domain-containing protein